uniref:Uncharacterized protein n=1 Tax=Nelumbo nucifera TaxID=4432 RepID=A0A822YL30_NELNU|nr:TPA_asm: hypothetical protein HUJ06_012141 [Nelumbo nucifera]
MQAEGAVAEDGRAPSIWDIFTHQGKMPDKSTGDEAANAYNKYKSSIQRLYKGRSESRDPHPLVQYGTIFGERTLIEEGN